MGVGELLRSERERKGLSLNDVENATKIRAGYIEALEKESFEEIPGEVYRLGFLKNYSRLLGLDPDAVVAQYKSARRNIDRDPEQTVALQGAATTPRSVREHDLLHDQIAQARSILSNRRLALGVAAVVVALLLIGTAGIIVWNAHIAMPPQNPGGQPGSVSEVTPQQEALEIRLVGREDCWAEVRVDGLSAYTGTIKRDETKTFTAERAIWMKLGNAGGVVVYYNGSELPPLGREWEVVTREFTKDSGA